MSRSGEVVVSENFDSLQLLLGRSPCPSMWNCIFVLPPWLKAWWHEFGSDAELYLASVLRDGALIGVAPLLLKDGEASFIGSADVCDYLDFIVLPGREVDFFTLLLDDLKARGVGTLDLRSLRPDSTVLSCLLPLVRDLKYDFACEMEDRLLGGPSALCMGGIFGHVDAEAAARSKAQTEEVARSRGRRLPRYRGLGRPFLDPWRSS